MNLAVGHMGDMGDMGVMGVMAAQIEQLEAALLPLPQVEAPLTHRFAPGVYLREIFMPKGTLVIGQRHRTEHFNIVLSGKAKVMIDNKVELVEAPCVITSGVGVRKVLLILEDMRWVTVHPTDETDVATLEDILVEKSQAFTDHEQHLAMKALE